MALVISSGSEIFTDCELPKLSSSASLLSGPMHGGLSLTAVLNARVQCGKAFNSSDVSLEKAGVGDVAKGPVSCELVRRAVESGYRRYLRVT